MPVSCHITTPRQNLEDRSSNLHRRKNLRSRNKFEDHLKQSACGWITSKAQWKNVSGETRSLIVKNENFYRENFER